MLICYLNFSWSDITTTDIRPSACFVHSSCSNLTCKQRFKFTFSRIYYKFTISRICFKFPFSRICCSLDGPPSPPEFPTDGQKQIWTEDNFDKSSEQSIYSHPNWVHIRNYLHPDWPKVTINNQFHQQYLRLVVSIFHGTN